jgi:cysteinyl-tRNA synthetase
LQAAYDTLRTAPAASTHDDAEATMYLDAFRARFFTALDDDLNTSGAVSVLFDLANGSAAAIGVGAASSAAAFLHEALELLGLSLARRAAAPATPIATVASVARAGDGTEFEIVGPADAEELLPADTVDRLRSLIPEGSLHLNGHSKSAAVIAVIEARLTAKQQRDFRLADAMRDALKAIGVVVTDRKEGASWTVGA